MSKGGEVFDSIRVGDYVNIFQSLQLDLDGIPNLKYVMDEVIIVADKEIVGKKLGIIDPSQIKRVLREEGGKLLRGSYEGIFDPDSPACKEDIHY